jgi:thiopurine S-methyltransferase
VDVSAWHERWEEGRTGFHQDEVNHHLVRHWPRLDLGGKEQVLVPLCGASLDITWLAGRGHAVLGVETSPVAVRTYFERTHMTPVVHSLDPFKVHRFGAIEIWCGDFFELEPDRVPGLRAFYDRAALVALETATRRSYAQLLGRLLRPKTLGLLVGLEIREGGLKGPPFSVGENEVRGLFSETFEVEILEVEDVTSRSRDLVRRGAQRLVETVYRLERRSQP